MPFPRTAVSRAQSKVADGWGKRRLMVRYPTGVTDFCLLQNVQTGCGGHPTSCISRRVAFCPGIHRPGSGADQSPLSSAEVKNECN